MKKNIFIICVLFLISTNIQASKNLYNTLWIDNENNRVGICTKNPQEALVVSGNVIINSSVTINKDLFVSGNAQVNNLFASSNIYFDETLSFTNNSTFQKYIDFPFNAKISDYGGQWLQICGSGIDDDGTALSLPYNINDGIYLGYGMPTTASIYVGTAGKFEIKGNGTLTVGTVSDGQIGVGITNPAAKLQVKSGINHDTSYIGSDVGLGTTIKKISGNAKGILSYAELDTQNSIAYGGTFAGDGGTTGKGYGIYTFGTDIGIIADVDSYTTGNYAAEFMYHTIFDDSILFRDGITGTPTASIHYNSLGNSLVFSGQNNINFVSSINATALLIATENVSAPLSVYGRINNYCANFYDDLSATNYSILSIGKKDTSSGELKYYYVGDGSNSNYLKVGLNGFTDNEGLFLKGNGAIGIGTSQPRGNFGIVGSTYITGNVVIDDFFGNNVFRIFNRNNPPNLKTEIGAGEIYINSDTSPFIQFSSNNGSLFAFLSHGTDDSCNFNGWQKLYFQALGTISGQAAMQYNPSTGEIAYVVSALKYKENIKDMEDTSWIYNLRPVNFNMKTDIGKNKEYGLIAEEVKEVNESLVFYKDGEIEGVSYEKLIPILLNEIQKLNSKITKLEEQYQK